MARTDRSAVAKALDLLTALADADRPLRLTELADRVGLHRATAYRSLGELLARGFVLRDQEDRYLLGSALLRMTESPGARHALAGLARPVLTALAAETDRIASIQVLEHGGCRIIEAIRSPRYQRFLGYGGEVIEPWRSAGGMVLLAFSGPAQTAGFLDAAVASGFDADELATELDGIRRRGHAAYSGRLDPLLAHVAAPVAGAAGTCRAAVSVTGFVQDFDEAGTTAATEAALAAARDLEKLLGEEAGVASGPAG